MLDPIQGPLVQKQSLVDDLQVVGDDSKAPIHALRQVKHKWRLSNNSFRQASCAAGHHRSHTSCSEGHQPREPTQDRRVFDLAQKHTEDFKKFLVLPDLQRKLQKQVVTGADMLAYEKDYDQIKLDKSPVIYSFKP